MDKNLLKAKPNLTELPNLTKLTEIFELSESSMYFGST